mmetsp:Transcript_21912/g.41363  ORF Transcript_21912/g.41363 Transcript_21912/m.41363 type:complete len:847 (-) Transcript_21912:807-3347(-)
MAKNTSGDIENQSPDPPGIANKANPSPDPPARTSNPSPSSDVVGSGDKKKNASNNNNNNRRNKGAALAVIFLVVILTIVVAVTLYPPSKESDASLNTITPGNDAGESGSSSDEGTTIITVTASTKPSVADPFVTELDGKTSPPTTIAATTETSNEDGGSTLIQPIDNNATTGAATTTLPTTSTPPKEDFVAPVVYETKYLASKGPILSKVRMINPGVANGYDSCDDLREDMLNALKHYASNFIARQSNNNWHERCDPNNPGRPWTWGYEYEESAIEAEATVSLNAESSDSLMAKDPAPGAAGATADEVSNEDSFETNNQVDGVDEGDIVKSDGTYVYAAYGDLLYVWNATNGTNGISITPMPYEKVNETECTWKPWVHEPWLIDEPFLTKPIEEDFWTEEEAVSITVGEVEELEAAPVSTEEVHTKEPVSPESVRTRNRNHRHSRKASSIMGYPGGLWNPCRQDKPRILSLLLEGSRITVIASENKNHLYYYPSENDEEEIESTIDDYTKLTIRVYNVSEVPTDGSPLELLGEKEIKGNYDSARSIDNTGLVVTTSNVNKWSFTQDLYRHHPQYCGMNSTEYEALAVETALNKTEAFLDRMLEDMKLQLDGTCDSFFQIAAMQSGDSDEDGTKTDGDMLSQFVQVLSFDMSANFENKEISTNVAGAYSSGWLSSVYASQGFVVTLNEGSHYNPNTNEWDSATYILGFDITGTTPKPFCYAEVAGRPGVPRNPYVTDFYEGHLRVVTTETSWSIDEGRRTTNKIRILKVPSTPEEGQEMNQTAETGHLGKPNENVEAVRFIGPRAYVVTFERTDPFYIYDLSDPTKPEKLGELEVRQSFSRIVILID